MATLADELMADLEDEEEDIEDELITQGSSLQVRVRMNFIFMIRKRSDHD